MVPARIVPILLFFAVVSGCGKSSVEVDHPFYLMDYGESGETFALFRCPHDPGHGCSLDQGFGPGVVAAGANNRFVVMEMRPSSKTAEPAFFYFARIPQETGGWGLNPEKLIGPLDPAEFGKRRVALGLPDANVAP